MWRYLACCVNSHQKVTFYDQVDRITCSVESGDLFYGYHYDFPMSLWAKLMWWKKWRLCMGSTTQTSIHQSWTDGYCLVSNMPGAKDYCWAPNVMLWHRVNSQWNGSRLILLYHFHDGWRSILPTFSKVFKGGMGFIFSCNAPARLISMDWQFCR